MQPRGAVCVLDQHLRIQHLDAHAARLLGCAGPVPAETLFFDAFPALDRAAVSAAFAQLSGAYTNARCELFEHTTQRWLQAALLRDDRGQIMLTLERDDADQRPAAVEPLVVRPLYKIASGLISRTNAATFIEAVMRQLSTLLDTPHTILGVVQPDGTTIRVHRGGGLFATLDKAFLPDSSLGARACRTGKPQRGTTLFGVPLAAANAVSLQECCCVPISTCGQMLGFLGVAVSAEQPQLSPAVSEVLLECAALLAIALQRIIGTVQDSHIPSDREWLEYARTMNEERLRAVFENSYTGIGLLTLEGVIVDANPAFASMFNQPREDMVGGTIMDLFASRDALLWNAVVQDLLNGVRKVLREETDFRRSDGALIWGNMNLTLLHMADDQLPMLLCMLDDITERKLAAEKVIQMAYFDGLTELPNRTLCRDRLLQSLARARRENNTVGLLYIDLDRFKTINDSLGHEYGDRLLRMVSQRLCTCIREVDTLARMNGDEFVVVLSGMSQPSMAGDVAERIIEVLQKPFHLTNHELVITASIGISTYPDDGADLDRLFQQSETAMYRAKEQGGHSFRFYDASMNAASLQRLELENDLRIALEQEQFEVYYQPRLQLDTNSVVGLEALVRWHHPRRGMVSPADFIPIAEETGLIIPLGDLVLRAACRQIKIWNETEQSLRVSVNISAQQLQHTDFVATVVSTLAETGVHPANLELEITEHTMVRHIDQAVDVLKELKELGVYLSIDDFGTGYSSLSYLGLFPIDTLKIDQSLIRNLSEGTNNATITLVIIALAHSLNLSVTAEGVETCDQFIFLREHGCDEIQGYLIGRPQPAATYQMNQAMPFQAMIARVPQLSA